MHAYYAIRNSAKQIDRIVAGHHGIGRVVLHAEVLAVGDGVYQIEENILLLSKLGVLPEAVLVVVFQAEDDSILAGDGKDFVDARHNPFEPLLPVNSWMSLTA